MAKLSVDDQFPAATLNDIDGVSMEFPAVFAQAPSTVIFFYRGRW
jgi:peroxiredoxin